MVCFDVTFAHELISATPRCVIPYCKLVCFSFMPFMLYTRSILNHAKGASTICIISVSCLTGVSPSSFILLEGCVALEYRFQNGVLVLRGACSGVSEYLKLVSASIRRCKAQYNLLSWSMPMVLTPSAFIFLIFFLCRMSVRAVQFEMVDDAEQP